MNIIHVLVCLIIIAILVNLIRKRKNKRFYELLEQFPSYPTYPLVGNAHMLLGSFESLLGKLEKMLQPNDRLLYWLGPVPCLCLKKHDDIAIILNQCHDRDTLGLVDDWLGIGILGAGYEEWKKSKKLLAPGFTSEMLSKYGDVFNANASNFVEKLKPFADTGEQIDVLDWIMNENLDAILENSMGITTESFGKSKEDFCDGIIEGLKHSVKRVQYPFLLSNYINIIYLKITGKFKPIEHVKHLPNKILRDKLDNYQINAAGQNDENSSKTIIDILAKNSSNGDFTETRLRDELLQIIIAAVDATALNISFLMLMLAMNQDIQQKVYEEIAQLTEDDNILSEAHLNNLEYLEHCIKETLRMFAFTMVTSRRTHKEILLKDNTIVPKGIFVAAFIHFANYDPDLYKNPEKWDPEHFSEEAVNERPKTSQLSFGYGPRSCLGTKYAMMTIKTQIAYILRNYHLSTDIKEFTKEHLITDLSIRSKIGFPLRLTSRRGKISEK